MAQSGHTQNVAGSQLGKRRNLSPGGVHTGAFSGPHCRSEEASVRRIIHRSTPVPYAFI